MEYDKRPSIVFFYFTSLSWNGKAFKGDVNRNSKLETDVRKAYSAKGVKVEISWPQIESWKERCISGTCGKHIPHWHNTKDTVCTVGFLMSCSWRFRRLWEGRTQVFQSAACRNSRALLAARNVVKIDPAMSQWSGLKSSSAVWLVWTAVTFRSIRKCRREMYLNLFWPSDIKKEITRSHRSTAAFRYGTLWHLLKNIVT